VRGTCVINLCIELHPRPGPVGPVGLRANIVVEVVEISFCNVTVDPDDRSFCLY